MSVILTVEDEFFISEYLRLLLEQAGYEVVPTHNADEAIAVLEGRSDIHTIITDINMPGSMDGRPGSMAADQDHRRYGPQAARIR
jgi:CheY-like chemotaxis protein